MTIRCLAAGTLLVAAASSGASAQIFAGRALVAAPLDDSATAPGLLPGFYYSGDLQRGYHSAGNDRGWDARLGTTIELWRFADRHTSLVFGAADEMVANAKYDGGFDPRGIAWELTLGFEHRFRFGTIGAVFEHNCRHELDDLDPVAENLYAQPRVTQRTLSVNGPRLRLLSPILYVGGRTRIRLTLAGDAYQHKWDGRLPDSLATQDNSWLQATNAASGAVRLDERLVGENSMYVRASGIRVFFRAAPGFPVTSGGHDDSRLELGFHVPGQAGAVEVYGVAETVFDDMMSPMPRPSRVVGFGLRIAQKNLF